MATRLEIAELYVATFNRAADATGLAYWISDGTSATTTLTNLEDLAAAMTESTEYTTMYNGLDREATVIKMYNNLFGRTVDGTDEGAAYWITGAGSTIAINKMIIALENGAKADTGSAADKATLENKATVGLAFADAGLDDVATAKSVMSGVTSDVATVTTATATVDTAKADKVVADAAAATAAAATAAAEAAAAAAEAAAANTTSHALTQGVDILVGDAGTDIFNGFLDSSSTTYGGLDTIDGAGGVDTLNAYGQTGNVDLTKVTNVEKFTFTTSGALTVDMSKTIGETALTTISDANGTTFNKIGAVSVELNALGNSTAQAYNYDTGVLAGTDSVTVNTNTSTGAINVNVGGAENLETLTVNNTGGNSAYTLGAVAGMTTLNITGDKDLNIAAGNTAATVTTINASTFTGDLTLQASNAADLTITTGTGDDTLYVGSAATKKDTINLGEGTDTLVVSAALVATNLDGVTGMDILGLATTADLTQDMDLAGGVNEVTVVSVATATHDVNLTDVASGTTVNIDSGATTNHASNADMAIFSSALKTDSASDTITINYGGKNGQLSVGSVDLDVNYETINIVSEGTSANVIGAFGNANGNIMISGSTAITLTDTTNVTGVIDFSGSTANNVVTVTSIAAQTITFGAGNDTLTASGIVGDNTTQTINGGAGDDSLTAGAITSTTAALLVLNGGAGDDTLSSAALNGGATTTVTLNGGTGFDVITTDATDGVETIVIETAGAVDSDRLVTFETTADKIDYNGTVKNDSATTIVASEAATLKLALSGDADATVYSVTTDLAGAADTDLVALSAATKTTVESLYATFEASFVAALGTVDGLDTTITSGETVLLKFEGSADSVILEYTQSDTSVANTITVDEIKLVAVIDGVIAVGADFA